MNEFALGLILLRRRFDRLFVDGGEGRRVLVPTGMALWCCRRLEEKAEEKVGVAIRPNRQRIATR